MKRAKPASKLSVVTSNPAPKLEPVPAAAPRPLRDRVVSSPRTSIAYSLLLTLDWCKARMSSAFTRDIRERRSLPPESAILLTKRLDGR